MKNLIKSALLVMGVASLVIGMGGMPMAAEEHTPALKKVIEGAKAEGGILIAHATFDDVQARKEVEEAMEKMYGVDITWEHVDFPNQNRFASRLLKEVKAGRQPSTDVFNGTQSSVPRLMEAGVLAEVDWKELYPRIPETVIVPGGGALPEHSRLPGFTYNTRVVPKAKVPKKLDDFLDPFWKGKLASTTYAAVWDRAAVGEDGSFDEEKAKRIRDLLKELVDKGHIVGLIGCGDENRIASGEFAGLAMMCSQNGTWKGQKKGMPLDIAYLPEVSNISHSYLALMRDAKYPNTAKLFMVFMQTPEGQALNLKWELADVSYYPGTRMYATVQELEKEGTTPPYISIPTYLKSKPEVEKWKKVYKEILVGQR